MSAPSASALMAELRSLGVSLSPEGARLRYRGSREVLTPDLLEKIRERKVELLELLQVPEDLTAAPILETRVDFEAVRVRSRPLGLELWLARDDKVAAELRAEMSRTQRLPVILFEEIPLLRGKSLEMCRALLDVRLVFLEGRLVQ